MATMPDQYYNRFDPAQNYDEHLFLAGRGLQSAELNEIQRNAAHRVKGIADALFKDGDIIRDAGVVLNSETGVAQCASGAIYLRGAVRGVPPKTITVPIVGALAIGIRLVETVITATEDTGLLDPAPGTRNYAEPGADRLKVECAWGWSGDGGAGEFYPVYSVTDGALDAKEPPPSLDAVTQSLARYDRDSAGGCYVVSGLNIKALADDGNNQVYSLSEGRARVYGYGLEFATSRRVLHAAAPDLLPIANEPHLSTTASAQRVNFDRTPGTAPSEVSITAEKTVTLTHGVFTGAQDPLPDTSVLSIIEVKQGATTYTPTTDYLLTAGKVDWSPAGAEPAPGSTYTVKYRYITDVAPTAVDDTGFTVTGAVSGTLILVTYSQKLPRIDRLCLDTSGRLVWVIGVSSAFNPQPPSVPADMLALASVYQTWTASRAVSNDGVRVVTMPRLAGIDDRLDLMLQLIAQNRLESNIHTREAGAKKGLFTDPFLDDSQRDAGTAQTAAIAEGELVLPISATVFQLTGGISAPATLNYSNTISLSQPLRTGSMKINPYMNFDLLPASVKLTPEVDRWTEVQTNWQSPLTSRFVIGWGNAWFTTTTSVNRLLSRQSSDAETLRPITVNYKITGFGAGETVSSIKFDGIARPTGGAVANSNGEVNGSFVIPAGVPAGVKLVEFLGQSGSRGAATFTGQGTVVIENWRRHTTMTTALWRVDPLAQTFTLTDNQQISAIDLWFTAAPTSHVSVQLRSTTVGVPNSEILAEAKLAPSAVLTNGNPTRFNFDTPVSVLANIEYALVVLCDDSTGAVSVAELGKYDESAQRWITSQAYTVGVLLSSSNASTWTAHQDRDLAFRILRADYTQTTRTVALGTASVANATDLILMSFADRPSSITGVQYRLTLPDATVLTVDDNQPIKLAAPITGTVSVDAVLSGDAMSSPIVFPNPQLIAGTIGATGTYVSRAIPAGTGVSVKVIYEAVVPSGATVSIQYKGPDAGDTWATVPQTATRNVDDGFVEFTHLITGVTEATVQVKITLNGTTAARPRMRDLRTLTI